MRALGIDVCTGACSVAVTEGGHVLCSLSEPMPRGHVERLAPMVAEALEAAGSAPGDLELIAVTTGPGSFTGARLGVSFARGLAMAAGVRAVGVSVFEAMAQSMPDGPAVIALDGRKGDIFLQEFSGGLPVGGPAAHPADAAWRRLPADTQYALAGSGKNLLLEYAPDSVRQRATLLGEAVERIAPEDVARLGIRLASSERPLPSPLYLRAPDARPQTAAE